MGEARRIGKMDSSAPTVLEYESPRKYPIPRLGIGMVAVVGIVAPLIYWTQCRAAYVTPVLTVGLLGR